MYPVYPVSPSVPPTVSPTAFPTAAFSTASPPAPPPSASPVSPFGTGPAFPPPGGRPPFPWKNCLLRLGIYTLAFLLAAFLAETLLQDLLSDILFSLLGSTVYYVLINTRLFWGFLLYAGGFAGILLFTLRQAGFFGDASSLSVHLRKSLWQRFLLSAVLLTMGYFLLVLLISFVFTRVVSRVLYPVLGDTLYYALLETRYFWILFFYALLMVLLVRRTIFRAIGYLTPVAEAVSTVLNRADAPIRLPKELAALENDLHTIRYRTLRDEQNAREAEQRKNDLVVYLAHDLKTPLTSIIGYISLLEEAPDMPTEQRAKYTAIALDKAYRLEQLINEFFEITRFNLQSISLETNRIHLTRLLEQVVDEFYPMLSDKQLTVETSLTEDLVLYGDADKLARVMDNLLRNAVSYSYPETTIRVTADRAGDAVRIAVSNTGDPISPQQLTHIFEKFFRLDSARQSRTGGAGLGLAIAKQIVELHGGSIAAASSLECTTFTVILPLQPAGFPSRSTLAGSSNDGGFTTP